MTKQSKAIADSSARATILATVVAMVAMVPPVDAAPSNRADPCALVTAADAQTAIGVPMGQPKGMDDGLYRHCTYESADGRFYLYISTIDDDQASFEQGRKLTARNSKTVEGLGANAYFDPDHEMLLIWKKGILLNIQAGDHSGNTSLAQLEAHDAKAAAAAIPRL
jgi:hypothetical protein